LKEMAGWLGVRLGSGLAEFVDEFAIGPRGLAVLIPSREQGQSIALRELEAVYEADGGGVGS
jgi:hypothetical protein